MTKNRPSIVETSKEKHTDEVLMPRSKNKPAERMDCIECQLKEGPEILKDSWLSAASHILFFGSIALGRFSILNRLASNIFTFVVFVITTVFSNLLQVVLIVSRIAKKPGSRPERPLSNDKARQFVGLATLVMLPGIIQVLGIGTVSTPVEGLFANFMGEMAFMATRLTALSSSTFEYGVVGGNLATIVTAGISGVIIMELQSKGSAAICLAEKCGDTGFTERESIILIGGGSLERNRCLIFSSGAEILA